VTSAGVWTRAYRSGSVVDEGFEVAGVAAHLADADTVVWVDVCAPADGDLGELAALLGLHPLAVEDALGPHQRPKIDRYPGHLFLACHAVQVDAAVGRLHLTEVDAFVGPRWLVSVRKDDRFDLAPVLARLDGASELAHGGVGFILHGLLDAAVDTYFDAVLDFDTYYDDVSDGLFADVPLNPTEQRHWFHMRRSLVHLHRVVAPLREVVSSLVRGEHHGIDDALVPYFVDLYDHVLRVSESIDSLRDLATSIVEANLSLRDYRQNLVMKKITSWAGILAVPTLVTGFYGMNVPFPGQGTVTGAVTATVFMLVPSAVLFLVFRRREWL